MQRFFDIMFACSHHSLHTTELYSREINTKHTFVEVFSDKVGHEMSRLYFCTKDVSIVDRHLLAEIPHSKAN